jgi:hypothetical protein
VSVASPEFAQRAVPCGFELVGDQSVGGVDREVAAAGQVGVVLGALNGGGADAVGVVGSGGELVGDGQRGLQGQRGDGVEEEPAHVGVDPGAGDGLADRFPVLDAVGLADVLGHLAFAHVVAHGHPAAVLAADDQSLEQGGAFAGWAGAAVVAVGGGVGGQADLVGLELFPADVAGMGVGDQHRPLLARQDAGGHRAVSAAVIGAAAVEERAGVTRVVQHL